MILEFMLNFHIDNNIEVEYYKHGGTENSEQYVFTSVFGSGKARAIIWMPSVVGVNMNTDTFYCTLVFVAADIHEVLELSQSSAPLLDRMRANKTGETPDKKSDNAANMRIVA